MKNKSKNPLQLLLEDAEETKAHFPNCHNDWRIKQIRAAIEQQG